MSFSPDGEVLASGSRDALVRLWDATSGSELRVLTGHTDCVTSVAFGADGATLATGSYDGTIIVWDVSSRTPPTLRRVILPARLAVGRKQDGSIRFEDPEGDVTRVEVEILQGDPATIRVEPGLSFDPGVRGETRATIGFSVVVAEPQMVTLRFVLVDATGLRSEAVEIEFLVE